jgi:hypothetical protein
MVEEIFLHVTSNVPYILPKGGNASAKGLFYAGMELQSANMSPSRGRKYKILPQKLSNKGHLLKFQSRLMSSVQVKIAPIYIKSMNCSQSLNVFFK